jgi:predicted nucleic acid-binding protein
MMKIYLDTCSVQRPLDSKNQIRILLEADAVLVIIALCDAGQVELVSSDALLYETRRNPNLVRKDHALAILDKANTIIALNDIIEKRARLFVERGIKPLDALHLASAEAAGVDYLCTCDDRFLKKAKQMSDLSIKIISPVALIEELNL